MQRIMSRLILASLALFAPCMLLVAAPARADDRAVPYWVSIRTKAKEVNMRVGPAHSYRISWLYRRPQMPLKVLRLQEAWRLVEDPEGQRGWMLQQFLSPERSAMVSGSGLAEVHDEPAGGRLLWRVEPGVVGKLGACEDGWCRFDMGGGHVGYVLQTRLWGAGAL